MSAATASLRRPSLDLESSPSEGHRTAHLVAPQPLYLKPRPRSKTLIIRLTVPLLLVLLWTIGSETGAIPSNVLASPAATAKSAWQLTASGVLWHHLQASLSRAAIGLFFGGLTGLVLGTTAGLSKLGEELIDPSVQMIRSIPFLALVPLFIVWFGIGETSKILLVAAAAAKPMYLNAYGGMRGVDPKLLEAGRVFKLSRRDLITQIHLPAALPSLMVGLRLSTSLSLIALIGVEVINTSQGLGFLMLQAQEFFKTEVIVVCIVIYALFGLAADLAIRALEYGLMPWRRTGR